MTAPAEQMHAAAQRIREKAAKAMPGPWESMDDGDRIVAWKIGPDGFDDDFDHVIDEPMEHGGNAAWIALMSPDIAEPLAAWLESAAKQAGKVADPHALMFARAILGEAP